MVFEKNIIVCRVCALHEKCLKLEGLPPCALVADTPTSPNTTKALRAVIHDFIRAGYLSGIGYNALTNGVMEKIAQQ
jgi:hypothetical protein